MLQDRSIGSLFTGVAGLDLGLELCGMGPVLWQCDSDPAARAVLEAHWPGVKRYADVREIDVKAARPAVLCGGFPCQPVSLAGQRKAQADTRWLWPFFAAVVAALRPPFVFIENVPGLRTAGLRDVLADLAALGFDAQWDRFSAAEVGAPHRRIRLFVLAYAHGAKLRHEPGRGGGARGDSQTVVTVDGGEGALAHAHGEGELQQGGVEPAERRRPGRRRNTVPAADTHGRPIPESGRRAQGRSGTGPDGESVADTDGLRFVGRSDDQAPAGEAGRDAAQGDHPWAVEPGVRGVVDGSAEGLDGSPWDAGEWPGVSRVQHGVKGRVDRLRLLGNACVPQQAALAWRTLIARAAEAARA